MEVITKPVIVPQGNNIMLHQQTTLLAAQVPISNILHIFNNHLPNSIHNRANQQLDHLLQSLMVNNLQYQQSLQGQPQRQTVPLVQKVNHQVRPPTPQSTIQSVACATSQATFGTTPVQFTNSTPLSRPMATTSPICLIQPF